MTEAILIPETASAPSAGPRKPFDLGSHAAALKDTPKEHYKEAVEPEPPPTTEPPPNPDGDIPGGDGTGTGSEGEPSKEAKDSARLAIDLYDTGVGMLCEAVVDDPQRYPAERFHMRKDLRSQAETQLAKGIALGGGKFKLPWWAGLLIVLSFQGFLTWRTVKAAQSEKAARNAPPRPSASNAPQRDAGAQSVYTPSSITDRNGKVTPIRDVPKHVPCAQCGNPVAKKGRKYCSQRCSGLATSAKRRKPKTTPTTTIDTTTA